MAQLKTQNSLTILDLTDITDVYLEYCMVEAGKTASEVEGKSSWVSPEIAWSTIYPTWQSGYEIWVRQVQIKEGVESGIYTIQFSATTTGSVIFRLHGYDSNGQWVRQLFTTTITSTSTLPIIQTLELPSDIKFVRLSYPLTGVENTGIFKGESTSSGTGLIDVSTNESGSIPASGTPATNSSFNRTQLIAVYPQGYGTPYLDTAVNRINDSVNNINVTINTINLISEEFKYLIGTIDTPIFGTYTEKTINNVIEGRLGTKEENNVSTTIWLDTNGNEVTVLSSNNLYHERWASDNAFDIKIDKYYLYQDGSFIEYLYDEGFLTTNTFYSVDEINGIINIGVSKFDKYYQALFYANKNEQGGAASNPKYYIVNDDNWFNEYPGTYNNDNPIFWIKRTRLYADNNVQTDIYQDKSSIALYKEINQSIDATIIALTNSKNKYIQNSQGVTIAQALNGYDVDEIDTYGYNTHIDASGIKLRYNEFSYTDLDKNGLKFYYFLTNNNQIPNAQGPVSMDLNNNGISFYQLYEKNINNVITYESKKSFEINKEALIFYTPPNSSGDIFKKMELNSNSLIIYDSFISRIAEFGENTFIKGSIQASGGTIGGINITEDYLYTGSHNTLNSNETGLYISYQGDISGGPQGNNGKGGWALKADGTGHFGNATIIQNDGEYIFKLNSLVLENKLTPDDIIIENESGEKQTLSTTINLLNSVTGEIANINSQLGDYTSHIQVKTDNSEAGLHHYILITAGEIGTDNTEEIKSGLKLHDQYISFQISDGAGGTVQAAKMTNDTLEIDKINLGYTLDFGRYILEERIGGIEGTHFSILIE